MKAYSSTLTACVSCIFNKLSHIYEITQSHVSYVDAWLCTSRNCNSYMTCVYVCTWYVCVWMCMIAERSTAEQLDQWSSSWIRTLWKPTLQLMMKLPLYLHVVYGTHEQEQKLNLNW